MLSRVGFMILSTALLLTCVVTSLAPAQQQTMPVSPDQMAWAPCGDPLPKGCEVAVAFGDPSKGSAGVFARMPAGYVYPRHSHSYPEHVLLVKGQLMISIEGGPTFYLTRGTYAEMPGQTVHWARCEEPCLVFLAIDKPFDTTFAK